MRCSLTELDSKIIESMPISMNYFDKIQIKISELDLFHFWNDHSFMPLVYCKVGLGKIFSGIIALFVGILMSSSIIPASFADVTDNDTSGMVTTAAPTTVTPLAALTNVIVEPSNNLFSLESHYVIGFTTATTGTIKVITITFPAGFNIASVKLILASGIGSGGILVVGQTLTYAVDSPISVPAGTNIMLDLGKIVNNAVLSNTVSITTKDTLNNIIDGPTASAAFTLKSVGTAMLGANSVTNVKIANGAVTNAKMAINSINSTQIQGGTITNTKIANNSINGTQIQSGTITDTNIATLASIAFSKLAAGLLPSSITINSANIVDGSITKADISASSGIVTGAQACVGKLVAGFDSSGNAICKSIRFVSDMITSVDYTGDVGRYTSIAIGTDGFPVISYNDNVNGDLKLVHCTSTFCGTYDTPVILDSAGIVGQYTSIAIGTDGFPVISYNDGTNADLKLVHCTSTSCGTHDAPATIDATGVVGFFTSIAIGADGFPVISNYDNTNTALNLLHCTSVSCSTHDAPAPLDSIGDVGLHTSAAIGTDGFPVVSYYDVTNSDLKLVHCTSASCSTHDAPLPLDSTGIVGLYTSIKIGTDGFPVISYNDASNGHLKLVHCTNTSCSTNDIPVTLDSTSNVGLYTSIAIGPDGFPVISYYDATNSDLKLVYCTSASCSTHDAPVPLDNAAAGQYTSIAIGKDRLPVISYYDITNGDLKVVQRAGNILS